MPSTTHVLIVDDDAMSRDLLETLLAGLGHPVATADSGDAALALLAAGHRTPEIVLSDIQMPGISRRRLPGMLRTACGEATLLIGMSASGAEEEVIASFDAFLLKPFTLQQFVDAISFAQAARSQEAASKSRMSHDPGAAEPSQPIEGAAGLTPEMPQDAVLNERIYQQLAQSIPGPQLHQMYSMCILDARDRVAAMREDAAHEDRAQFVRQAHAIKGGCGMLGATELYGMAARLERVGLAEGVNPLDELSAACDRLEDMLGARA